MSKTEADSYQLSPEMIQKISEFADKVAWEKPNLDVLRPEFAGHYPPLAEIMQDHITASDTRSKLVLPDLRAYNNGTVGIFTDYGGESGDARYLTYATLVCGWDLSHQFIEMMKIVRQRHRLGTKEIAFKDFGMGQVKRSLPNYLSALNVLPGFLFTLAVDKRLTTLFGPEGKETREAIAKQLSDAGFGERKPAVNEKLLRVVHVVAFLVGLLSHDGQNVFWMTDHDSIAPNPEMHEKTLVFLNHLVGVYSRQGHAVPLVRGMAPFADDSLGMLDLLSATDIVAGALDQYLSRMRSVAPADVEVKEGCDLVLRWLAYDGVGLKKMNLVVRPGKNDAIEAVTLELDLQNPPQNAITIPISI